ncbi:nucleoside/nucleotide kinase family protein [Micromonospora auratinigra]|uniref:Uridine kinase n=1 Tax=Micromonospora auratinigra TaxID=261654 RepID=A0A1A8ZB83_9ACTN|nr:hypothetical protein [Micromonospora auratinigra]SBT41097.1 uridine kinase [Micromonospora auratinigra]
MTTPDRRAALLARLAAHLAGQHRPHPLRVAIDGPDAAGKTRLADDLARALAGRREVIRVSVDGFHRPAEQRRRRGPLSPQGYYRDSFDHETVVDRLLRPLPAESLRRALVRDRELFGSADAVRQRYQRRYLPGQALYRAEARPAQRADILLDLADPLAPVALRWPG